MGASTPKRRKNKVITDECLLKLWKRYCLFVHIFIEFLFVLRLH